MHNHTQKKITMYKTYTYDDPEQEPSFYEAMYENEVFTPGYDKGIYKQVGRKKTSKKGNRSNQKLTPTAIDPIQDKHPFYKPYQNEENKPLIYRPIPLRIPFDQQIVDFFNSIAQKNSKTVETKHSGLKYKMTKANADAWPVKQWKGAGWNVDHGWFGEERKKKGGSIRKHKGVDVNSNLGQNSDLGAPVYATHDGLVQFSKNNYSGVGGAHVYIQTSDKSYRTAFFHLDTVAVEAGESIKRGQQIGTVGGSGNGLRKKYKAHIHYEIHKRVENGKYEKINPEIKRGVLKDVQDLADTRGTSLEKLEYDVEVLENKRNKFIRTIRPTEVLLESNMSEQQIEVYYEQKMNHLNQIDKKLNTAKTSYNKLKKLNQ